MFLITSAVASSPAATVPSAGGFDPIQFLPMVLIFGVMYFLLIRPQQKKAKEHQATIAGIRKGDRVITSGGIIGVVHKVDSETEVTVEIADNVNVRVLRATISSIVTKPEPANAVTASPKKTTTKKA
ncbi:MAG: preprotein translocase subunit YajC [Pseudomonadota bacterium]